jgi:uncharacterized membrane-anchored protein
MNTVPRCFALTAALALLPLVHRAADLEAPAPVPPAAAAPAPAAPAPEPKTVGERLAAKGVKTTAGPAKVKLGKTAEFQLAEGQYFVGSDSLDRFYELTQNNRSGNEVGVVIAPGWSLFFDYDDVGYVKDDEKDKLDAAKLLSSMQENEVESNKARKERGWEEIKLQGWASPPHYDEKTHNLKWALHLSSSGDGHKGTWINENIRLLGKGGIMNVTLVCSNESFAGAMEESDRLLAANFNYVQGQRYAEWRQGDKIAAYGLSALVLGGGAAVAAKMGLFSKLGVVFAKMWKLVVVAVGALGAAITKLFRKLTGSHPTEPKE